MTIKKPKSRTVRPAIPLSSQTELGRATQIGLRLAPWFAVNGRDFPWRSWRDPYRVAIGEIMLQRTTARVVAKEILRFVAKYPDWRTLAGAEMAELESDLTALGLQRRRAQVLSSLANAVVSGKALDMDAPGIGQYVHRAIKVATEDAPLAMVDTNFSRILKRVFVGPWKSDLRFDSRLQALAAAVVETSRSPRLANWAIMDIGATVCLPRKPLCGRCPLVSACQFAIDGGKDGPG